MFRAFIVLWAAIAFSVPAWAAKTGADGNRQDNRKSEESFETLLKKGEAGDADALWKLSDRLFEQYQRDRDPETMKLTVDMAKEAARRGNGRAANLLGVIYSRGIGVERDAQEGARWYARSAELGEPVGKLNHALRLLTHDDRKSMARAKQLLKEASDEGVSQANFFRGRLELSKPEEERNTEKGVALLRSAAEGGMADAMFTLFRLYDSGHFVTRDKVQAQVWLEKAARKDQPEAQSELGVRFMRGDGVKTDPAEAVKWFRRAAENGSADGMTSLAVMYATGEGVEQDYEKAFELYSKAAERGSLHAMKNLAGMYVVGQHVEADYLEAAKWLEIAARLGSREAVKLQPDVAKKMTDEQKAEAKRRAENWLKERAGD